LSNYKIAKLSDQVYEIQNFITEDELDQVMQFVELRDSADWDSETQYEFWSGKTLKPNLLKEDNIFDSINQRAKTLFSGDFDLTGISLHRYMMDDALGEHTDDHEGHRVNSEKVFCGIVIYYNDEYEGGELNYPNLNIVHKPRSRSLVLHGGEILHGTLPVKSNSIRYISTMFVKHKLNEVVHLNKKVFGEVDGI
jgi:hypothetical protein